MPSCFSAATTFAMASLFLALAACAVEARVCTPSCTIARSGTAFTSTPAETVIVRDGSPVVGVLCAATGATANREATTDNGKRKRCMVESFLLQGVDIGGGTTIL